MCRGGAGPWRRPADPRMSMYSAFPGNGTAGKASSHNLGHRCQVRPDIEPPLGTTGRDPEAADHLVHYHRHAVPGGELLKVLEEPRVLQWELAPVAAGGLQYHGRDVADRVQKPLQRLDLRLNDHQGREGRGWYSDLGIDA